MTQAFCFNCMSKLVWAGVTHCPLCSASLPYNAQTALDLLPESELHGRYVIGRCLGRGGFGATYIAYDRRSQAVCAVKEFFPYNIATRSRASRDVSILRDRRSDFEYYKQRFFLKRSSCAALRAFKALSGSMTSSARMRQRSLWSTSMG